MKLKYLLLFFSLQLSFQMIGVTQTFQIIGKINQSMNGNQVMLFNMLGDSILSVDTTIIENGSFEFHGKGHFLDVAIISAGNYPEKVYSSEVILENGTIIVDMNTSKVAGQLNELYNSYLIKNDALESRIRALYAVDNRQAWVIGSDLNKLMSESKEYRLNTLRTNISNAIGYRILNLEISNLEYKDLCMFDSIFPSDLRPDDLFKNEFSDRNKMKKNYDAQKSTFGSHYLDFELLTPDNEKRKLSEFVGKSRYLYLEFWASWCGPCIADIPNLKKVYNQYNSKGLEIVGISVDNSASQWKNAINRAKTPWIQLSDLKGSESEIKKAYHVMLIPQGILIDQMGTIVASCSSAEELGLQLSKLLDK